MEPSRELDAFDKLVKIAGKRKGILVMKCPHCDIEIGLHHANKCLDSWVAEHVMGWDRVHCKPGGNICFGRPDDDYRRDYPNNVAYAKRVLAYSTDIAAAFAVDKPGWLWEFQEASQVLTVTLYTSFEMIQEAIRDFPILPKDVILIRRKWLGDKAATYAWLRCLAALEAVDIEEKEKEDGAGQRT